MTQPTRKHHITTTTLQEHSTATAMLRLDFCEILFWLCTFSLEEKVNALYRVCLMSQDMALKKAVEK
jgi:hypothetical protein